MSINASGIDPKQDPRRFPPRATPSTMDVTRLRPNDFSGIKGLTKSQIVQLSQQQIQRFHPLLVFSLTKEQQESFTPQQLKLFKAPQILALVHLTPEQKPDINFEEIKQLKDEMKRDYLGAIIKEVMTDIDKAGILCASLGDNAPGPCQKIVAMQRIAKGQAPPVQPQYVQPQYVQPQYVQPQYVQQPQEFGSVPGVSYGGRKKSRHNKRLRRKNKKTRRNRG